MDKVMKLKNLLKILTLRLDDKEGSKGVHIFASLVLESAYSEKCPFLEVLVMGSAYFQMFDFREVFVLVRHILGSARSEPNPRKRRT